MSREQRPAGQIVEVRKRLQREMEPIRQAWLPRLVETLPPIEEGRPLEERLSTTDDFGLALDLSWMALAELSLPAGIPLERLNLSHTPLSNLGPLRGLPLRYLDLRGCTAAAGYAVLAELSELETLRLHDGLVGFDDKEIEAIGALRGHAKLKQIESVGSKSSADFEEASVFWSRYDRNLQATETLRAFLGVEMEHRRYFRYPDWSWTVSCTGLPIDDLEPLRGLPVVQLDLMETRVHDLSPLEGMPLTWLRLINTDVTDLTPLATLPLVFLHLEDCAPGIDVTHVSQISTLENLYLPPKPICLNALRSLPKLEHISYQGLEVDDDQNRRKTADFWADTHPVNEGSLLRVGKFTEAEAIIRDRRAKYQLVRDKVKLGFVQLAQGDVEAYRFTCQALVELADESIRDERQSNRRRWSDVLAETVARLCLLSPTLPISNTVLEELLKKALPLAENPLRGCFYHLTAGLHAYRRGDYGGALRSFQRVRTEHYDGVILAGRAGSVMAHWNLGEEKEASSLLEGLEDAAMAAWKEVPDHSQYWLEYAQAWLLVGEAAALVAGRSPIADDDAFESAAGEMSGRTPTVDVEASGHNDSQEK